jgi:hypothetical protein
MTFALLPSLKEAKEATKKPKMPRKNNQSNKSNLPEGATLCWFKQKGEDKLVPVYTVGETDIYYTIDGKETPHLMPYSHERTTIADAYAMRMLYTTPDGFTWEGVADLVEAEGDVPDETVVEGGSGETATQKKLNAALPPTISTPAPNIPEPPEMSAIHEKPENKMMPVAETLDEMPPALDESGDGGSVRSHESKNSKKSSILAEEESQEGGCDLPLLMNPLTRKGILKPGVRLTFAPLLSDDWQDDDHQERFKVVAHEGKMCLSWKNQDDEWDDANHKTFQEALADLWEYSDTYYKDCLPEEEYESLKEVMTQSLGENYLKMLSVETGDHSGEPLDIWWESVEDDDEKYAAICASVAKTKPQPKPKAVPKPKAKAETKGKAAAPPRRIGADEKFIIGTAANFKKNRFSSARKSHHAIRILQIVRDNGEAMTKQDILDVVEDEAEEYCGGSTQPWKVIASNWIRDLLKGEEIVVEDDE